MKVAIVSFYDKKPLVKQLKRQGFQVVKKNPDFIISYGGDGTILVSERFYPEVPKLAIKNTGICHMCELRPSMLRQSLEKIKKKKFLIRKETKLEAHVKGKKLIGLNEIQLHTKSPIKAIRFSVNFGKKRFENLIGDGVIVATPFGSTAYYQSTGGKPFNHGIGISFNNLHNKRIKSFVVPENSRVEIKLERDEASLFVDNNEKFIRLKQGDRITVKKSKEVARFIKL